MRGNKLELENRINKTHITMGGDLANILVSPRRLAYLNMETK